MPLTEVVEVMVPLLPGLEQIVLPVKTSEIGLEFVATFTALLFGDTHEVEAFVPIT